MSRLYDAVESGSHGQLFKAKESAKDAYAELSSRLESARTTDSARGRSLDRLPKHAPFDKAHRLVRELRTTIDDAERLRKRLSRSIYGDAEQIRAALRSEGDPRRRRRRR
jgi:hypothetical protein